MTPFLNALANHSPFDSLFDDLGIFDCKDVFEVAFELGKFYLKGKVPQDRLFLPFPKTWIELKISDESSTFGILLTEINEDSVGVALYREKDFNYGPVAILNLKSGEYEPRGPFLKDLNNRSVETRFLSVVVGALILINSPRTVIMDKRTPSRQQRRAFAGKYPLLDWTVVQLKPELKAAIQLGFHNSAGGGVCLHRVRQHLRFKNGQIELVSSHWRGDAALGIKQQKYEVLGTS